MKEDILDLGFIVGEHGWYVFTSDMFEVKANPDGKYFYIELTGGGYDEAAMYPYINKEKMKLLLDAHAEYFK